MKKVTKILALVLVLVLAASLSFACDNGSATTSPSPSTGTSVPPSAEPSETPEPAQTYKISIVQQLEHVALSAAREGFIAALADNGYVEGVNVTFDIQISSGDTSNLATIADQVVSNNSDLILCIATGAAQAVAAKTTDIPILGTAITDYVTADLIESNEQPGGNISGTTDMNPIADQIDLLVKLVPDVQTVGFVYNAGEPNSVVQIDIAKAYVESLGLAWKEVTVATTNDVQQAVTSIVTEVEAIYLPTDNVMASSMPLVYSVTVESKTPVICAESGMVNSGGLATLGLSYYDLGYQTGLMAIEVLNGASTATMPIKGGANFEYLINKTVAEEIGITIPADLQEYVKEPTE